MDQGDPGRGRIHVFDSLRRNSQMNGFSANRIRRGDPAGMFKYCRNECIERAPAVEYPSFGLVPVGRRRERKSQACNTPVVVPLGTQPIEHEIQPVARQVRTFGEVIEFDGFSFHQQAKQGEGRLHNIGSRRSRGLFQIREKLPSKFIRCRIGHMNV